MRSASWLSNLLAGLKVICYFTISHQTLPEARAAVPFLLGDKGCMVPMVLSSPSPLAVDSLRPWECTSRPLSLRKFVSHQPFLSQLRHFMCHREITQCILCLAPHTEGHVSPRRQASLSNKDNCLQNPSISRGALAPGEESGQYHMAH